jgi:hypothetical protein
MSSLLPGSPLWLAFVGAFLFNAHGDGHCGVYCVNLALHLSGRDAEMLSVPLMREALAKYEFDNPAHRLFFTLPRFEPGSRADLTKYNKDLGLGDLYAAAAVFGLDIWFYNVGQPMSAPERVLDILFPGANAPVPLRQCSGPRVLFVLADGHFGVAHNCAWFFWTACRIAGLSLPRCRACPKR